MMGEVLSVYGFIIGAIVGSFMNMLAYRLAHNKPLLRPSRSFCPKCRNILAWYDNIPLLSYIFLRGQCRNCHEKISVRYFLVELFLAVSGAILTYTYPPLQAATYFVFLTLLAGVTVSDLEAKVIPDEFTLLAAPFFIVVAALTDFTVDIQDALIGAFGAAGATWLINEYFYYALGKDGLGFGDMKLFYLLGSFFGYKMIPLILFFASMLAIVSYEVQKVSLSCSTKQKESTENRPEIAFGPYICAAALIVFVYGEQVWQWYVRLYS